MAELPDDWEAITAGSPSHLRRDFAHASGFAYDERIVAKRIGELLLESGLITEQQLEQALAAQKGDGRKLGQVLIDLKLVGEMQLTQALSRQLSVPWVSLYHVDFSRSLLNLVPRDVAEKYMLVPIYVRKVRKQGDTLYVAMDDPTNEAALGEVAATSGLPVRPMIACPSDVRSAIRVYYGGGTLEPMPAEAGSNPQMTLPTAQGAASPPVAARLRDETPSAPPSAPSPSSPPRAAPDISAAVAAAADAAPGSDSPDSSPVIEAREIIRRPARGVPMIALTLLDGTTIQLPAAKKRRPSRPESETPGKEVSDQLTARDLVSALRAVAHGVDATEILGAEPKWEVMFAALLSIMLRKGLIADWEFIEEFRKV
jgi:type IV pilus assembly protein PilB